MKKADVKNGKTKLGQKYAAEQTLSNLSPGELYLFHKDDPNCPLEGALWGIYDHHEEGMICLESMSYDLQHFERWAFLPQSYRYGRISTRAELRDYMANATYSECSEVHAMCP